MKFFLCVIGMVLIVEGLPYFAFPDTMRQWMKVVQETTDTHLRVIGFVLMCIGLVVVYLFR